MAWAAWAWAGTTTSTSRPSSRPQGTKWAEVDVAALRHNTSALVGLAGAGCETMAMVKANAYGHGAELSARAALSAGASRLGVSSVAEALELRRAGIDVPILNVGWSTAEEMRPAAVGGIEVAVFEPDAVAAARAAAANAGRPIHVHWKIDTGMGRLGTRPDGIEAMRLALREARADVVVAGLFTHLASADAASEDFTRTQLARFTKHATRFADDFPGARWHAANSAGLLRFPESRLHIVRPGIAMYGYPPVATALALRPVLSLRALVSQVKTLRPGDSVGYARQWTAARPSLVATIAAGYGDGVDRRNGGAGSVILGGALCPIIGRVSMDQIGVDVTDAGTVLVGDVATLIGADGGRRITAADVAARIGTISYEVLCAVAARVPRVAVDVTGELP